MIVTPDENGLSDCNCDGGHWLLSYFTETKIYHFLGQHAGRITGKDLTIHYFDSEDEMLLAVQELEIIIPIEED